MATVRLAPCFSALFGSGPRPASRTALALLVLLACAPEAPTEPVTPDPVLRPAPSAPPAPPAPTRRADRVSETWRDGFGPGTTIADFVAFTVPRKGPRGPTRVMKVYVDAVDSDAPAVHFIDTRAFETHWWFVGDLLGEDFDRRQYAIRTYYRYPRPAAAVNLVLHTGLTVDSRALGHPVQDPITMEMGAEDAIPPELALTLMSILQERMSWTQAGTTHRLLWLPPTDADQDALAAHEEDFRAAGVAWLDRGELLGEVRQQILNPGVAYGTLRYLTPDALRRTVVSSRDILLLTEPVNALPLVAGTITEALQTPLSHVSIAARARGTPNMALLHAARDARVAPLIDQLVRLEVTDEAFTLRPATPEEAEAHWSAGLGVRLDVPPADRTRDDLPALADLGFDDSSSIGVKAANVAELGRVPGTSAPEGFAVPFAHYDRFMRESPVQRPRCRGAFVDCAAEGRAEATCSTVLRTCYASALAQQSLRDYALQLLETPAVQADPVLREASLDGLRYLIGHAPVAPALARDLDAAIEARFGDAPVRLRSSTNAEDLPDFSGAGLYRSVSAHARGERRASSRIRKVWASVWSWRAVEERAAWGIPHEDVYMGVLVHPAYRGETANGVLVTADLHGDRPNAVTLNLQAGQVPVTNPEGGATPEVVVLFPGPDGALRIDRREHSSLSATPIYTDAELQRVYDQAIAVRDHFATRYDRPAEALALDLEIKRTATGEHIVKQARPYPLRLP